MSGAAPEKLWEPPAELVERSRLREFMRWLEAERGLELRHLRRALAAGRSTTSRPSGRRSGTSSGCRPTASYERVLGSREMPGAEWFAGTSLNYAEHVFAGKDDAETAILHASELRELGELSWGELRAQVAATAAGLRALGVERGDRVVAYMPNIPEAIVAFLATRQHRRDLVELLARLRPGQRDRPLRPDRAQGALRGRRLPLRRQGLRPARDPRQAAGRDAEPGAHRRPALPRPRPRPLPAARRDPLGRAARHGRGRRAELRARPLRPPALGPLLLRHHRPAEGDRAVAGRHPARAPEEAPPPRRRPPRRPPLLVHHDRLDDVELPRLRAADPGRDRALRRQPRPPRHGRALGPRRAGRGDDVRHQRLLHRRLHEGRGRARRRPRPQPPRGGRLDRLAALPRGLRLDLRAPRRRHLALLDQRRHRPLHRLRRRLRPAAGLPRRAAGARARRRGRGLGRRRASR